MRRSARAAAATCRAACMVLAAALLAGCFNRLDWREFHSDDGHYTVALPGKAAHVKGTLPTRFGNVVMQMDSTSAADAMFGVGFAEYPPHYLTPASTVLILDQVRDGLVNNIGGRTYIEIPLIREGVAGRSVHAEGRNGDRVLALDAHLLFAQDRFYEVVVIGGAGPGRIGKEDLDFYFNSFRVTP